MRQLILLSLVFLSGCASQQIKLNTGNQFYTEYKHIIDKRIPGREFTATNKIIKDIEHVNRLLSHDLYDVMQLEIDKDMLPIREDKFSSSLPLVLDIALEDLAKKGKNFSPIEITYFAVREEYTFFGVPIQPRMDCLVAVNFEGKYLVTNRRTLPHTMDIEFDAIVNNLLTKCVKGLINQLYFHERVNKNTS